MQKRKKTEALQRMRELRDIINSSDPIHLIARGCPDDEYECLIPMVFRQLESGRTSAEMAAELGQHIEEHFGLAPTKEALERLFERANAWYRELA